MESNFITIIANLIFTLALCFQTTAAQTARKIPVKESSLIVHLVKEANQTGSHSKGDVYLSVTVGKTAYLVELKSGKVVSQSYAEYAGGGISGTYAEVRLKLLDKNRQETAQGASQILKLRGGKWKRLALSESDYQCADLKTVPKSVLEVLSVECN